MRFGDRLDIAEELQKTIGLGVFRAVLGHLLQ
jgi:hypothetical protein